MRLLICISRQCLFPCLFTSDLPCFYQTLLTLAQKSLPNNSPSACDKSREGGEKKKKRCLSESLGLPTDPCVNFFVIPRPSQERRCSSDSWTPHGGLLPTAVTLWRGSGDAWFSGNFDSEILPSVPGAP